jgi:hypothetical protein
MSLLDMASCPAGVCTMRWRARICAAVLAVGWSAIAVHGNAVAADPVGDDDTAIVATESTEATETGRASGADEQTTASGEEVTAFVAVEPEAEQPQRVCRNVRVTGTRLPQLVCTYVGQRQGDELSDERQAQRFLSELEELSTIAPPPQQGVFGTSGPAGVPLE